MGVKRGNPKLISGVLLPSFILNYMLNWGKRKRVLNKKKRKEKREIDWSIERERVERGRRISKLGRLLVDSNSSVEVGYGFHAFIVNS